MDIDPIPLDRAVQYYLIHNHFISPVELRRGQYSYKKRRQIIYSRITMGKLITTPHGFLVKSEITPPTINQIICIKPNGEKEILYSQ